jgi:hypothetical protein
VTVSFEGAISHEGFILIITEAVAKCQTNKTIIQPIGRVCIQGKRPFIQSTITRNNLTGTTVSSIKLQTGGLRVCPVAITRGMEPTPRNGGNFEAKGVLIERDMNHLRTGNNPWQGAKTKGEDRAELRTEHSLRDP